MIYFREVIILKYIIYTGVLFMPDKNAASQRAIAISKLIEKCGYVPIIVGMNPDITEDNIIKTEKVYMGIKYYEMKYPNSSFKWIKMLFDYKKIIGIIDFLGRNNCKAIIAMDYFSPALNSLMKYCNKNKLKLILDSVDWFGKSNYAFPKNIIKNIDTFIRMRILNKRSDYLIVISKYLENYYKKNANHIICLPGIYYLSTKLAYDKYKIKNDYRTISFVGSPGRKCEKEKIDWVIEAICRNCESGIKIKFIIAGIDEEILRKNRPDLFALPNFNEFIEIRGRISHSECNEIISKSDFTVIIRENTRLSNAGFPTKLGESFAFGTPVLVTPTSDICDYIPNGYGFISDSCTYTDVEKLILKLKDVSNEEIVHMHEVVIRNNPLEYDKFIDLFKTIIDD